MNEHPVWTVYNELRTARLNVRYHGVLLARARRWNTVRELTMAGTGSTGVGGIWLFATPTGSVVWKGLASVSALLAVYQSVARPSATIGSLERDVTGWAQLEQSLQAICYRIQETGRYDAPLQEQFHALLAANSTLISNTSDADIDNALLDRCTEQVERELPPKSFFVPDQ